MNSVEINNLSLKYKGTDFKAIDNLSLTVQKGEVLGLLGPNGAGKTSLISILTGLIKPDQGSVVIEGIATIKDIRKIQSLIGVVPQEYALYPKLTAKENLFFFGSMYGVKNPELKQRINDGIAKMGLEKFANKQIETFSGGMKRRINLLAGVLHNPKVIFLDEPTVGVDVQSKVVIIDYLKQMNEAGTTIIYSSHLLHEAQSFCTRVAIIDHGKIQIEGPTHEVLISDGRVKSLEEIFIENTGKRVKEYV
ncbi:MAG TPA: ABC transporter ATP-binding protein [Brumimicrobium sp.]|nr:ABC transporter ATP-binding protein [Brumimicrobium sp.]